MNPQAWALLETSGSGRVLPEGKNAGGAREPGHVTKLREAWVSRPASRLLLPRREAFFEMARRFGGRGDDEARLSAASKERGDQRVSSCFDARATATLCPHQGAVNAGLSDTSVASGAAPSIYRHLVGRPSRHRLGHRRR